jgi:hypothetical protein
MDNKRQKQIYYKDRERKRREGFGADRIKRRD